MSELFKLFQPVLEFGQGDNWKMLIMWIIGPVLIYLAIKKQMDSYKTIIKDNIEKSFGIFS